MQDRWAMDNVASEKCTSKANDPKLKFNTSGKLDSFSTSICIQSTLQSMCTFNFKSTMYVVVVFLIGRTLIVQTGQNIFK